MRDLPHPFSTAVLVALGLIVLTVAAFGAVCCNEFTNYDDGEYVTKNAHVQAGITAQSVQWALTTSHAANWHPLTWLSLQFDYQLYGLRAWGYHLTNLLLHTCNVLLLFLVLYRMTAALWRSAAVAAFFAVHPLHVESVAWVAERKDVLSTLFWMLTIWAYVRYVERPGLLRYLLVLAVFALGLSAKPMLVTLPCVLLLLDFWPLRRFPGPGHRAATPSALPAGKLILEKAPLFLLTLVSSVMTLWAQDRAVVELESLPFDFRFLNALNAYVHYITAMFWPYGLEAFYPHPGRQVLILQAALAAIVLAAISVFVVRLAKTRSYLLVGWFWYLGTLVPVIGLLQVGGQAAADRYTYVPLIGLFIMLCWGTADLLAPYRWGKRVLASAAPVLVAACMFGTWQQVQVWRNGITLWEHACAVDTRNYLAHQNLATLFLEDGKLTEAKNHLETALRIKPNYADAHNNLGVLYFELGDAKEAAKHFTAALSIKPGDAETLLNLGAALLKEGRLHEARNQFEAALRLEPNFVAAHKYLAEILLRQGRTQEAQKHLAAAARLTH